MKDTSLHFDDDFYRLGAVILSDKFISKEKVILDKFSALDCPIPPQRFKTVSEYHAWVDKLCGAISDDENGLTPDEALYEIMDEFGIKRKMDSFRLGLWWKVYFGKEFGEEFGPILFPIKYGIKTIDNICQLDVTIFPWTKQEDFEAIWSEVKLAQSKLEGYKIRDRFKKEFIRDFLLYQLYIKLKNERSKGIYRRNKYNLIDKTSLIVCILDDLEFINILNKYGGEVTDMKKIVNYFNRLLKTTNWQ